MSSWEELLQKSNEMHDNVIELEAIYNQKWKTHQRYLKSLNKKQSKEIASERVKGTVLKTKAYLEDMFAEDVKWVKDAYIDKNEALGDLNKAKNELSKVLTEIKLIEMELKDRELTLRENAQWEA